MDESMNQEGFLALQSGEDVKMSTYMATIAHANQYNNTQHHVVKDIIANSMSGAFTLAMDDFFDEHDACEIRKVVVELQHSTWNTIGDIYCGS